MHDRDEKRTKTVGLLTPLTNTLEIQVGGVYAATKLGDLILKQLQGKGAPQPYVLRREDWQEYARGLKDAGVMYAHQLHDMFCTHARGA